MLFEFTVADVTELAELEKLIFNQPWSSSQIEEHLNSGKPIWGERGEKGQLQAYLIASEVLGEWEIFRIAVCPRYRHRGLARNLMKEIENRCSPGDKIFLEVSSENTNALSLYLSSGFNECGRRAKYYTNGDDAVLMVKLF